MNLRKTSDSIIIEKKLEKVRRIVWSCNGYFYFQLAILVILILSIVDFSVSNAYVIYDLFDKFYSAILLTVSMRMLKT